MALKVDYVVKETGKNLVRNPWLTIATVITVLVALLAVGGALLVREGVRNATAQWQGGVEFIVFMNPDATQEQIDSVQRDLDDNPQVELSTYLDHDAAYAEFRTLFERDSPELVESVTPDALPTSFKVKPTQANADVVRALQAEFQEKPGVREVVAATDTIHTIQRLSSTFSAFTLGLAVVLSFAAVILIANTIQTAMFARRREIEVMKLVGATNWFIRVPFMLEGVVQSLIGALVAVVILVAGSAGLESRIANAEGLELLRNFVVDSGDVTFISIMLLVGGVVLGAVASAVAVTFYLDV